MMAFEISGRGGRPLGISSFERSRSSGPSAAAWFATSAATSTRSETSTGNCLPARRRGTRSASRPAATPRPARERIDATYFHPSFTKLSERRQTTALYLLLDGALGEDDVERWLGRIRATAQQPDSAVPFSAFRDALVHLARNATGEQFVLLKGETEAGEPVFITCNRALERIDHLLHTMHVAVDLAILDPNPDGLTTPADAEQLNLLEDQLSEALGERALYFGRETKPGHRVMHWYAPEDSAAQAIIERWSQQIPERSPQIDWIRDPTWAFVKRYV